jgi:hypothetical protein
MGILWTLVTNGATRFAEDQKLLMVEVAVARSPHDANASSKALTSFRSRVSNPSVNHP